MLLLLWLLLLLLLLLMGVAFCILLLLFEVGDAAVGDGLLLVLLLCDVTPAVVLRFNADDCSSREVGVGEGSAEEFLDLNIFTGIGEKYRFELV